MTLRQACILATAALLALPAGCVGPPSNRVTDAPPKPVTEIDEVILQISPPVPLNLDERPGPDGVRARLYFVGRGDLPVTVSGSVDMMLFEFDASRSSEQVLQGRPFKTWTFTPGDLNMALGRTMIGWGYELMLLWGAEVPRSPKIVIRARYNSPTGMVTLSVPVTIEMSGK